MIPEIVQVKPTADFKVYVYFADGKVKLYDAKPLVDRDGVFKQIASPDAFVRMCTVLNGTLAWDVGGNYDETKCIDIDPCTIYESANDVLDPLDEGAA